MDYPELVGARMSHMERFFGPFGANEMFVSTLLGCGIQASPEVRALPGRGQ